jgi:hypothetical protein
MKVARAMTQSGDVKKGVPQFVGLAATAASLYAIDESGGVWLYKPAEGTRYAFWAHLTKHRVDKTTGRRAQGGQD